MSKYEVRSFNLTSEMCKIIDQLPNRSAWAREIFEAHLNQDATQLTIPIINKLITERIKALNLTYAPSEGGGNADIDITDELDALLKITQT